MGMRSKSKSRGSANDNANAKPVKKRRKKPCIFCEGKPTLDYKDLPSVRKFLSDRAKILPRRTTGCCALHQRMVAKTIKRAREISLIPYTLD